MFQVLSSSEEVTGTSRVPAFRHRNELRMTVCLTDATAVALALTLCAAGTPASTTFDQRGNGAGRRLYATARPAPALPALPFCRARGAGGRWGESGWRGPGGG